MALNLIEKYQRQFDHHIKCILESALLLDEDIESLITNYCFDYETLQKRKVPFYEITVVSVCAVAAIFAPNRLVSFVLFAPALSIGSKCLMDFIEKLNQHRNIECLIRNLRDLIKLNSMILKYLKERCSFSLKETTQIFVPYTKNVETMMAVMMERQIEFLQLILRDIQYFCEILPSLKSEYSYLSGIDLTNFQIEKIKCIEDCITSVQALSDIFILVVSNFLTTIGLGFCPKLWGKSIKIDEILNGIIPTSVKHSEISLKQIHQSFNNLKYQYVENRAMTTLAKRKMSTKMYNSLFNSVVKGSIVLEKSKAILEMMEKGDAHMNNTKIAKYVEELTIDSFQYYESLNILCKLYTIALNSHKDATIVDYKNIDKDASKSKSDLPTINADDPDEPIQDEEFEMYIGDDDQQFEKNQYYDDNESRNFLSLMALELQQSLKNHEKFLAARKKRGITDEELMKKPQATEKCDIFAPPLPEDRNLSAVACPRVDDLNPPPPPPLPILPLNLPLLSESTQGDNMLEKIKAISKQREIVEEVFGDNDDN